MQHVDVGGRRLAFDIAGMGRPLVVLEAGLGMDNTTWADVWDGIARVTGVLRYDRAGLGASAAAPQQRTCDDLVADLHALLVATDVPPPYVLVGNSLGGSIVRLFAHRYPGQIGGMVLVDSDHPDQLARFAECLPPPKPGESPAITEAREYFAHGHRDPAASPEGIMLAACQAQVRATRSLDSLPLVVLSTARFPFPPDFPEYLWAPIQDAWHMLHRDLAKLSAQGTYCVAEHSGHFIHCDQPDLVIDAVREVVEAVRAR